MFFSIRRACPSSSSIITMLTGCWPVIDRLSPQVRGQGKPEDRALVKLRFYVDDPAEAISEGAHVRQTDAFAGPVLGAGAAEQVENPLVILRGDSAAVVRHFVHHAVAVAVPRDTNEAGAAGAEVHDRVLDEGRQGQLAREAVADDVRQRV